ncbi:unnamed protein product, partial [marine sediment metagenome]
WAPTTVGSFKDMTVTVYLTLAKGTKFFALITQKCT